MAVVHLDQSFYADASRVLAGSSLDRPMTVEQISVLANQLLGWTPDVVVIRGVPSPVAFADSDSGVIAFSRSALKLSHALHEIAHLDVGVDQGHNAVFRDCYVELVRRFGSDELADALRVALKTGADLEQAERSLERWSRGPRP